MTNNEYRKLATPWFILLGIIAGVFEVSLWIAVPTAMVLVVAVNN